MNKLIENKLRTLVRKEIKKTLNESTNPAVEEFFNSIDFQPLTTEINKRIGIKIQPKYSFDKHGLVITTDNLIKHAGIFKSVITNVHITRFGTNIDVENKSLWAGINLSYPGNGMEIMTAIYKNGKWSFRGQPRDRT